MGVGEIAESCMPVFVSICGEHTCVICALTHGGLLHVLRDRLGGSHGAGGLSQVGGPVADALWLQGFGVALLTLCGGKQKKETKITISTRKKNEHSMPSLSRVHRTETHTVLRVQPHTLAILAQVPLFPASSVYHPNEVGGRVHLLHGCCACGARAGSQKLLPPTQCVKTVSGNSSCKAYEVLEATCPGTRLTCSAEESVCRDGSELMTVHIDGRQTYNAGTGLIAEGSPVVATSTRGDAVNSSGRLIICDIQECVAAKARDWMRAFSVLIVQNLLYIALVVICAFIYNRRRATFWRKKTPAAPSEDFHYGLSGCCRDRRT